MRSHYSYGTTRNCKRETDIDDEILTIYCLCDDLLKSARHQDRPCCQMSSAEVMTVALVAILDFGCNYALARRWLHKPEWIPVMLGKSRFSRRLYRVEHHFLVLFYLLAEIWKADNTAQLYLIDTFPVPVCDNYRIKRNRIYGEERHRGYKASKKRYFYGLKLHLLTTETGKPVEFLLSPGSVADVSGLYGMDFDLPEGAIILGDKAYNIYWLEDIIAEVGLKPLPVRKKNSKRPLESWERGLQLQCRQAVETAGSLIERKLPSSIHAVNAEGFELKVKLFVLGLSLGHLLK
jgi:hypothetical protein